MKTTLLYAAGAAALIIGGSYYFTAISVATAPSRVVADSVRTDNIIGNYEAFFDMKAGYDSRVAEIADLKKQLAEAAPADRRYAQTDLNGARQTCRSLAQRYNADSQKLNRGSFKAKNLPETLDANACEG